ncbi:MAG: phosphatase family protein [Chitinophagaceae bacterium]|jgi:membrane-associated phospholipid phosphatase|nr:phosphatase family protein [Chitinophagaceae bacterium]
MQRKLNTKYFVVGSLLSLPVAGFLFYLHFTMGLKESFLLLNGDSGKAMDYFFMFFTYFGDAALWVPMFAYIIWRQKKLYLPLSLASFALGTIFVHVCKIFIVPGELRPTRYITDAFIHTVDGVRVHGANSFPSGHTATAFVFFLVICLMTRKTWWIPVGFLTAVLVGYSRIYLAQHFPLDVAAGIIAAVAAVGISIPFQKWADRRYRKLDSVQ